MTAPETAASILRRAAALMRERAQGATPGRWAAAEPTQREGHRVGTADEGDWVAWTGEFGEEFSGADAGHIASWHPPAAQAVADWLDAEAERAQALISPRSLCRQCGGWLDDVELAQFGEDEDSLCRCWNKALAVARAYTGGGE